MHLDEEDESAVIVSKRLHRKSIRFSIDVLTGNRTRISTWICTWTYRDFISQSFYRIHRKDYANWIDNVRIISVETEHHFVILSNNRIPKEINRDYKDK